MHGLINRAIQRFAEDAHGAELWRAAAEEAQPGLTGFEAMLSYDDALTAAVLAALSRRTGLPVAALLEDLGTYLVRHPATETVRRLLRFGGESYVEFLQSLDELPDRVGLAVPDLRLPAMELRDLGPGTFLLAAAPGWPGFGHVLAGLLRAMADDYGALALVTLLEDGSAGARLSIRVADAAHAEGRRFELAARAPEAAGAP
ncbi:MAG: heme NO-binding domain-containing protein [Rhodobacteraceae bacterium]|nr:heme NO-binding domain-containing protein [Paracoccaceae bacterium]